jgi:pyridinium-3,5-bisthiocarboxylic acid mononucleotide nickel chelatase
VTRVAYLDCVGGLAGDMLVAALIDAGGDVEVVRGLPDALGLTGVEVEVERVERHGLDAAHLIVNEPAKPPTRRSQEMVELVTAAPLPERPKARALSAVRRLAEAEARVHGVRGDDVHFHELAGVDTLIDVCGVAALLEDLGVDRVTCSPLPAGRGFVSGAHGTLPLPAPATLELLRGAPLVGVDLDHELVTPTGAALAASLAHSWGSLPALVLEQIGYGAGSQDFRELPNVVRVILGETEGAPASAEVSILEATVDDLNPELVPDAMERCLAVGALDVWTAPVLMKKARPGLVFSALARASEEQAVARAILEETSTLGVRVGRIRRYELEREDRVVAVAGGSVHVKVGRLDGRVVNVAPEHDDCAALARRTGRSVKSVWAMALAAAQER